MRRADGKAVRVMMERVSGEPATMWGASIVGFGSYHHCYASGHEVTPPPRVLAALGQSRPLRRRLPGM
ncbi:MAG TPA: hypothetical protein VF628_10940 [Allosphingosinicella sp.]